MRYLFEDYTLDTERRELLRGAEAVQVTPQVFDMLEYLIRNSDHVVSRDDLMDAIWKGRVVSEAALTTRLNAARTAIGDSGEQQRLIRTLPRKGFRFIGAVQEAQRPTIESVASDRGDVVRHDGIGSEARPDGKLSSRPRLSIVVLPFANISGDPDQEHFAHGVTESLTTDLSRITGSFVIASSTAFTFKGKAVDVRQVGRELNVRYVLEGSVQRGGNRIRVNVQLIDAETSNHLWAERFDKPVADIFDMQDEIVSRLANTLNFELIHAEARRAERSLHPDAMDLCFQGIACFHKGMTLEYMARAGNLFERALVLDPENVEALVGLAEVKLALGASYLADDQALYILAAETLLNKALSQAPDNARAHRDLGQVKVSSNRALEGIAASERALELNRNLAESHATIGWGKILTGRPAEAEAHVLEALRLSPRDLGAYRWLHCVGIAKLMHRADAEAVVWLRRSLEANRNYPIVHLHLGAALMLLDRPNEAAACVREGMMLDPKFTIRRMRRMSDHPTFRSGSTRIRDAMRMAGVPEGS